MEQNATFGYFRIGCGSSLWMYWCHSMVSDQLSTWLETLFAICFLCLWSLLFQDKHSFDSSDFTDFNKKVQMFCLEIKTLYDCYWIPDSRYTCLDHVGYSTC